LKRAAVAVLAILLGASILGCERDPPDVRPYNRPTPRKAASDPSCGGILASEKGARWSTEPLSLRVGEGHHVAVGDASILAGPFEPPLRLPVPAGTHPVRVVLGPDSQGAPRAFCVEIRFHEGKSTAWKELGDVAIDTDTLAIIDEEAVVPVLARQKVEVYPALEAPADSLPQLATTLAQKGLPLTPMLPTLWRGSRPVEPGDRKLVEGVLRDARIAGDYTEEPSSAAWPFVVALMRTQARAVDLGHGPDDAALAIESAHGDGAYAVALGSDADGTPVTVEIRLFP
jgi:hypothetical protein